ncbi:hypothetical protein [Thermomonas sp.]|uniref:hypothetical protein n=1 Tax=Thermomonas sp. TaxID=1971895 RepID=UPI002B846F2B|nr:hypothetical protein [Thermomonas sp.]HRO63663.1 hypothetical protein [Thermomonas sp.]
MNRFPPEPLDAEERALAAQLPRLRGRGEPAPELDARILAAARTAQPEAGHRSPRQPRHWQMPAALAASLCLAVGLAWQLRQAPSRHAQMDAARPVATESVPAAAAPPALPAQRAVPAPTISPMVAPAQEAGTRRLSAPAAPEAAPARSPAAAVDAAAAPPQPRPEAVAQEALAAPSVAEKSGTAHPAPAPAAPPAPVAPPPAAPINAFPAEADANEAPRSERQTHGGADRRRAMATEAAPAPKALAAPAPAAAARPATTTTPPAQAAAAASAARTAAETEDADADLPPATMDSPSAREAWLRRIAELAHAGRMDEARASLAEFRRRYPNERIPAVLKGLEQETPR